MKNDLSPRTCHGCTACCDGWVTMNVHGHDVLPGSPCPYSSGSGCKIYDERPVDPCRNFMCGWIMEMSPLPDWMRPDLAKVILLPGVRVWRGLPVDLAVPVGRKIPGKALNWLKTFAAQRGRPLIYTEQPSKERMEREQTVMGFGTPEFMRDIQTILQQGKKLW